MNLPAAMSDGELFTVIPVTGYLPPADSDLTYNYPFMSADHEKVSGSDAGYLIPPVFHNEMLDNSDFSEMSSPASLKCQTFLFRKFFFQCQYRRSGYHQVYIRYGR